MTFKKMLKKILVIVVRVIYKRPLPHNNVQINIAFDALKSDLDTALEKMPMIVSSDHWSKVCQEISNDIQNKDIKEFLTWPVMSPMYVDNASCTRYEYHEMKTSYAGQQDALKDLLQEDNIGRPYPSIYLPLSSGNRIHHNYHLFRYEKEMNEKISNYDVIIEFGGGYGSMCRVTQKKGFRGQYIIIDLPIYSALQKYYLTALDLGVKSDLNDDVFGETADVFCLSDYSVIEKKVENIVQSGKKILFISTWALSETPTNLSNKIFDLIKPFQSYLFAYQDMYDGIKNENRFSKFLTKIEKNKDLDAYHEDIHLLPCNRYLFIKTKEAIAKAA